MSRIWQTITLLCFCSSLSAQIADPGFAKHLSDQRSFHDLIEFDGLNKKGLTMNQLDSVNFYTGWAYYHLQDLDSAIVRFSSVNNSSGFFNQANFFASWCEIYQEKLSPSLDYINIIKPMDPEEIELALIFRTGIALLEGDLQESDSLLAHSNNLRLNYRPSWDRMELHHSTIEAYKPKSYAVAGLLSGILPGSGKIYAGQKGAGISSLLTLGVMAAVTVENGLKTGWSRWNTIGAASLFSIFYIGNIYGSIAGIKVYRERFHDEVKRAILLDINIPLRDIYR